MKTNLNSYILATTLTMAISALSGAVNAEQNASAALTDARQETQIWTTYELSHYLRANKLQVSVQDNKATLTGTVQDDVNKELAEQIALGVSGITDVDNQIKVSSESLPAEPATEERSYGQVIDDASITAAVKSRLLWSKNSRGMATDVDTNFGRVTLHGTADNDAARELAGKLAENTSGVVAVDNQLTIKKDDQSETKDGSKKSAGGMGEKLSDSWITTKVKSTFIYSSNIHSSGISVSTVNGLVTLSGKVGNGAERELAIEAAQNVRGVKTVQSDQLIF